MAMTQGDFQVKPGLLQDLHEHKRRRQRIGPGQRLVTHAHRLVRPVDSAA
jgi:hypothetical protein